MRSFMLAVAVIALSSLAGPSQAAEAAASEHGVAESQCVKCNPKLAKEGVK